VKEGFEREQIGPRDLEYLSQKGLTCRQRWGMCRRRCMDNCADPDAHRSFIAGGIAACGAVTVTHGFETVKIRYA
jgi:hypothetical protein